MGKISNFLSSIKEGSLLRFKNRESAASTLAGLLIHEIKANESNDIFVIGIARGGVIMADVIAKKLNAIFEIIIARKLRAPHNEELAIGSVIDVENPLVYLDQYLIEQLGITSEYIESEKQNQIKEIKRRESIYKTHFNTKILVGKTVILVDDGAAMGATLIVSARWIKRLNPRKLIIAIPVAPKRTVELLKKEADHVESLITPSDRKFVTVGSFYQSFPTVSDEVVIQTIVKNSST